MGPENQGAKFFSLDSRFKIIMLYGVIVSQ